MRHLFCCLSLIALAAPPSAIAQQRLEILGNRSQVSGERYGFDESDVRFLESLPEVRRVLPSRQFQQTVRYRSRSHTASLIGTSPALLKLNAVETLDGRLISSGDLLRLYSVAVISEDLQQKLFAGTSAVGEAIRIGPEYFRVIGVVTRKSSPGEIVYLPVYTLRSRFGENIIHVVQGSFEMDMCRYDHLTVLADQPNDLRQLRQRIERFLATQHPERTYSFGNR